MRDKKCNVALCVNKINGQGMCELQFPCPFFRCGACRVAFVLKVTAEEIVERKGSGLTNKVAIPVAH